MQPPDPSYSAPPSSSSGTGPEQRCPPPQSPKPPSRTNVDRLLTLLHLRKAGKPVAYPDAGEWKRFKLSPAQFEEFQRRLDQDEALWGWFHDKAHYDYDPLEHEFVLRMPSVVHQKFLGRLNTAIWKGLDALAERLEADHHEETARSVRDIRLGGSGTVYMDLAESEASSQSSRSRARDIPVQRSPDFSLYCDSDGGYGLVLEVSYSRQKNALPRLAESYILDSSHRIRRVVGFDITYASEKNNDQTATVSVWRAAMEKDEQGDDLAIYRCDVDAVAFRDGHGAACAGELELFVGDLLPDFVVDALPEAVRTERLTITFAQLTEYLAQAEAVPKFESEPRPVRFRVRKRKRSASEVLSAQREEAFLKQEEAELKKDQAAGAGWRSSRRPNPSADQERRRSKRNKAGRDTARAS